MRILAIETSCDETALALLEAKGGLLSPEFKVKQSLVSSQIKLHAPFGGVVPMLAKREHAKNLPLLFKKIWPTKTSAQPDLIAVTVGPGLEPALWEGINFAQKIGQEKNVPVLGVNHLAGHIYSNWVSKSNRPNFPAICLLVSGGHTLLLLMTGLTKWRILGSTRDDAVGESFDKVARLLNLPYPGGPALEKLAATGNADAIDFPRPMIHDHNFDFSYSGLKTAVLYYLRDHKRAKRRDVAASFQKAAFAPLVKKALLATSTYKAKSLIICGGVAGNGYLRDLLRQAARQAKLSFHAPAMKLNTDNAVMIAAAGYIAHLKNAQVARPRRLPLKANGRLRIS